MHVPFCARRCAYCDFASSCPPRIPHLRYARALLREFDARAPQWQGELQSVYLGGGTPSQLSLAALELLLEGLWARLPRRAAALEVTIEANPADLSPGWLRRVASLGVNRVSLGVQSFDERSLRLLERRHDAATARRALAALAAVPSLRGSFDLICGLPEQTLDDWDRDLNEACDWAYEHLSVYCLSLEPDTPLERAVRRGALPPPDEDLALAMLRRTQERLASVGLRRYEISNYARIGCESRHNSLYWSGGDYLGLGAAAHSHRSAADGRGAWRWANSASVGSYLRAPADSLAFVEELGPPEIARERLICELRRSEGLDLEQHGALAGRDLRESHRSLLQDLERRGLAMLDGARLRLSPAGFDLSDAIIEALAD